MFHHPLVRPWPTNHSSNPIAPSCTGGWPPQSKPVSPATADENAALIAEHLEAAGEMHAAYGWHLRAGTWATNRDINAARLSWERATRIADALPDDDPNRPAMRIAPRTMLCGTAWRVDANVAGDVFR